MTNTFDRVVSVVATGALLALVGLIVRREGFSNAAIDGSGERVPVLVREWTDILASSRSLFSAPVNAEKAQIVVVEYSDLQCPACRIFHESVLPELQREFGDQVEFRLAHFPLPSHPQSRHAAIAAECAAKQGKFGQYVQETFARQDRLAQLPWLELAEAVEITDLTNFSNCMSLADTSLIAASFARARRIGLKGTPAILVNGWRNLADPSAESLRRVLRASLDTIGGGEE